jgi:hypothetical protein
MFLPSQEILVKPWGEGKKIPTKIGRDWFSMHQTYQDNTPVSMRSCSPYTIDRLFFSVIHNIKRLIKT